MGEQKLYRAALASLILMIAATLLYPDTYLTLGLKAGPFRISGIAIVFACTAPLVASFVLARLSWLRPGVLDLMLLIAMFYVGVRGVVAAENGNDMGLVLAWFAYALLLYYGAAVIGQGGTALRAIFYSLAALALVISLLAVVEFALGWNFPYQDYLKEATQPFAGRGYHRSGSTTGHPVTLGAFLVQVSPFLLFLFIRANSVAVKLAWGGAIVLLGLALLVTYSKGAWGTAGVLVVGGLAWLAWRRPTGVIKPIMLLALALVAVLGAFTLIFYDTVYSGTLSRARTSESISPRSYMWSRVPDTFLANPLIGAGMWRGSAEVFRVNPAPEKVNRPESIDNLYLTALVEQGIIGVLLAGGTIVMIGRQVWKLLRSGGGLVAWCLPLGASMLLILINGISFNSLMEWPTMVVFWLCAGLVRSLAER